MTHPGRIRDFIARDRTFSYDHEVERNARWNSETRARGPRGKVTKKLGEPNVR